METKYKDSGIPWIGLIPENWEIGRLKDIGSFYGGLTGKAGDDFNVDEEHDNYALFIPFTNIFNNEKINCNQLAKVKVSSNEKQNEVSFGDILFLMSSEDSEGIGKSSVYLLQLEEPIYLNSFCKGLHVINGSANSTYVNYYMSCAAGHEYTKTYANGFIRINLRQEMLSKCPLLMPSLEEQERIAAYLDTKCGEIDELIEVEKQMISDLESYRQAVITEAVTHGLNPDVPTKDTGIPWIGLIPEHWRLSCLKRNLKAPLMYGANEAAESDNRDYPRYIRITDIDSDGNLKNETFKSLEPLKAAPYLLTKGDILFARSGATVGKTYLFKEEYKSCFAGYLIKATCSNSLFPKFLFHYTYSQAYENWKNSICIQATIQNIGADKYSMLPIPLPPLSEQQEIADYLDAKCAEIDDLIKVKQEKIETLKQYRQSLIFEAVTGKTHLL